MTEPRLRPLPEDVLRHIANFVDPQRGLGTVEQLPLRQLVADYCDKYIALDVSGRPAAFVVLSPPTHANSVRDASNAALAARDALGPVIGDSVLTPHFVGYLDGCSYSITRYCKPISNNPLLGRWHRLRLRPAMLGWLAVVTRQTAAALANFDTVRNAMGVLAEHNAVSQPTRQAAARALIDLDAGAWTPQSVLAHNDLWWGNFVHRPEGSTGRTPFYVIDWAGSHRTGMPFYDLVRISRSLNVSPGEFRGQMEKHVRILECQPKHMLHYLSAAFGTLAGNLGEWPETAFARTADDCLQFASAALR